MRRVLDDARPRGKRRKRGERRGAGRRRSLDADSSIRHPLDALARRNHLDRVEPGRRELPSSLDRALITAMPISGLAVLLPMAAGGEDPAWGPACRSRPRTLLGRCTSVLRGRPSIHGASRAARGESSKATVSILSSLFGLDCAPRRSPGRLGRGNSSTPGAYLDLVFDDRSLGDVHADDLSSQSSTSEAPERRCSAALEGSALTLFTELESTTGTDISDFGARPSSRRPQQSTAIRSDSTPRPPPEASRIGVSGFELDFVPIPEVPGTATPRRCRSHRSRLTKHHVRRS